MTAAAGTGRGEDQAVAFGPFQFVPARRLLTRDGDPVALGFRALEVLRVLIAHAPEVVGKAGLLEQVWPGVFVEETALRFHVSALRRALGDGEDNARYISTASGKGYAFVAPLHRSKCAEAEAAPLAQANAKPPPTNLLQPLSEIIGREPELEELCEWLSRSRLVSVVGPGGIGKTRLALELGVRQRDAFPEGVWLVDLAPLATPDKVPGALAAALGLSVKSPEAALEAVASALGRSRALLIFDNCEHLTEPVGELIQALLGRASGVSMLVTSQRTLNLSAEQVFVLDPLRTPPACAVKIGGFPAVQLFAQRAYACDKTFELNERTSPGVGEICRQLDGLPLALEMAARRLRMLGVEGLRRGLADRLHMLRDPPHGIARHSSLHGMLEWSHNLLTPFDQRVFRRLAVFPASFALEAAIAVAREDEAERWAVIDAVARLLDQSLIVLESREPARYRLLETMRLYGAEKLHEAGETDAVGARHADHFTTVFREADDGWETTPDAEWIDRYRPDLNDLRSALAWTLAAPERAGRAITLAASGCVLFYNLSLYAEGRAYLDRVLPLLDESCSPLIAGRLLRVAAEYYLTFYDPRGFDCAQKADELLRTMPDHALIRAQALLVSRSYLNKQGLNEAASYALAEADGLLQSLNAPKAKTRLEMTRALVSYLLGDNAKAVRQLSYALEMAEGISSRHISAIYTNLGVIEFDSGNIERAISLTQSALDTQSSHVGNDGRGMMLLNLAAYMIFLDRFAEARLQLRYAFQLLTAGGAYPSEHCIRMWAILAGLEGDPIQAARLIGFADADRERLGQVLESGERPLYNRLMDTLRAALPAAELDALVSEGARWSRDQAVAFVATRLVDQPPSAEARLDARGRVPAASP